MAGLDADTSVYSLSNPQKEGGAVSPLDMLGKAASVQSVMNQNALFQQEFRAKQALGPIAQSSVGPDGQMDWGKFAVNVASDPNAAFLAPTILQSIAQKQLLDAQTISEKLGNNEKMFNAYAAGLGSLLPKGDAISQKDVLSVANMLHANGTVDDDHLMQFLSQMPSDDAKASVTLPTGQVVQRSALAQYVKQNANMAALRGDALGKTIDTLQSNDTGAATVYTRNNALSGTVEPASGPGAVIAKGPSPQQANEMVTYQDPQTGQYVTRPRFQVAPMMDSSGRQTYQQQGGTAPGPSLSSPPLVAKPSPFGQQYGENLGNKISDYVDGVNQGAHQAQQALVTLGRQMDLLKKFRSGGGAYWRTELAQAFQGVPVPEELEKAKAELVQRIQGGDDKDALAAAQEFEKYAAIGAMQSLIQAQGSHYRPAAIEYSTIFKNFPRANIDPKASRDMIQLTRHLLQQTLMEQQYMEKFHSKFGNEGMASWPSTWSKILAKSGYLGIDKNLYGVFGGKNWENVNGALNGQ